MSYVYAEEQRRMAEQAEARRQAEAAEQRRLEQQQWDRQRQMFQESILQQEQSRRGTETSGKLSNENLGINKNFELGKYGEDTKRQGQSLDLQKAQLANDTSRYGMDKMSETMQGFFGGSGGRGGASVSLHDNAGTRIGGTYSGGTQFMKPGSYNTQNFGLRDSLLRS